MQIFLRLLEEIKPNVKIHLERQQFLEKVTMKIANKTELIDEKRVND